MQGMEKTLIPCIITLLCCYLFYPGNICSQEEKIVPEAKIPSHTIISINHISGIEPAQANVKKGTTVIWVNDSRSLTEVEFTGKKVTLACKSPVHFVINEEGSFISNKIPQGAVASLCFVEKGEFDYVVRRQPSRQAPHEAPREYKGKIIVE